VIAKTSNSMYRLNVQVTAYGRQTVPHRGVVRSCDPFCRLPWFSASRGFVSDSWATCIFNFILPLKWRHRLVVYVDCGSFH